VIYNNDLLPYLLRWLEFKIGACFRVTAFKGYITRFLPVKAGVGDLNVDPQAIIDNG